MSIDEEERPQRVEVCSLGYPRAEAGPGAGSDVDEPGKRRPCRGGRGKCSESMAAPYRLRVYTSAPAGRRSVCGRTEHVTDKSTGGGKNSRSTTRGVCRRGGSGRAPMRAQAVELDRLQGPGGGGGGRSRIHLRRSNRGGGEGHGAQEERGKVSATQTAKRRSRQHYDWAFQNGARIGRGQRR